MNNNVSIKGSAMVIALGKYVNALLGIIANIILARLLNAEEYGIIAILTVFTTFFQLFADMGFGSAVIQNRELDQSDLDNIYSYTIYFGVILMVVFMALSKFIASMYNNDVYNNIGKLISLSLLFNTWNMLPNAILLKHNKFRIIGTRTVIVSIVTYGLTVLLAYLGFSYYALAFQSILFSAANYIWNSRNAGIHFRWTPRFVSMKKVLQFSMNSFLYDIINYFSRNLDNLLIGKYMGSTALGYYNKAYQLILYPNIYITASITSVLHPIFSNYGNDKRMIYNKYMDVFRFLMLTGIFVSAYFNGASGEIVNILYGRGWGDTIPCFKILGTSVCLQMVISSTTSIFRSLNRTDLRVKSALIYVPIQIVMIVIGVLRNNIVMLSYWVSTSFVIRFFVEYYFLIKKGFMVSIIAFVKCIAPSFLIFFILMFFMDIVGDVIHVNHLFASALLKLMLCGSAFVILVCLFRQDKYITNILPKRIKSKIDRSRNIVG